MTSKTGWTPEQICKLTLGQIRVYVNQWNKDASPENGASNKEGGSFNDMELFNLVNGIKRVPKPK